MIKAMGGKCQCCSYDICSSALAFHHIDPSQKDLSFGSIRASPHSWEKIVEELRKCILVCHNCHSEIHAGLRTIPSDFSKFDESFTNWKKIEEFDNCPKCGTKKNINSKFCSHSCAQTNRRRVDWQNVNVTDMLEKYSISELEKLWGISNAAIYKRRKLERKMLGTPKTHTK